MLHWWEDNKTFNRIFFEILIFLKPIPRILCSPKGHCRVQKSPYRPTRVYFTPSHPFFKTLLILYFHLSLCLPGIVYHLGLPTKLPSCPIHATCPAHFTSLIWSRHQYWLKRWNDAYRRSESRPKNDPVPTRSTPNPHGLAWARTWVPALSGRRLTA